MYTDSDLDVWLLDLHVLLEQKYTKLKHVFTFRTESHLSRSLCNGILLLDLDAEVLSRHICTHEFK